VKSSPPAFAPIQIILDFNKIIKEFCNVYFEAIESFTRFAEVLKRKGGGRLPAEFFRRIHVRNRRLGHEAG